MSSVRSRNVKPLNAVCVESTAVGRMAASTPIAEMTGSATVSEHFPTHEISCTVMIRFIVFSFLKNNCAAQAFHTPSLVILLHTMVVILCFAVNGTILNTDKKTAPKPESSPT